MTKEQYEKISAPFRKNEWRVNLLVNMDRGLTMFVFTAYPLLLLYLGFTRALSEMLRCISIPAVSFFFVSCFRAVYSAPRPYEKLNIQPLIKKETKGKSFPSRHVFSVFMIGMTFFYINRWLGLGLGLIGAGMSYIRVAGGVHFPKDVAAGAVIGILCGMVYFIL